MDRSKFGKLFMELIGTAILLLTIQISVSTAGESAPVAIGVVLITIVYAGGPISGAHYNPAVSLAVHLRGKMTTDEMLMYWVFQIVGAVIGASLGGFISDSYVVVAVGDASSDIQACLAEACFTFLLCLVVLCVATHSAVEGNSYYGAAIGLVVMSGALAVGSVSGAAFNPAVALGLCIAKGFANMVYVSLTVIANLLGGAAAAGCFYLVAPDQFENKDAAPEAPVGETTGLLA